MYKQMRAEWEKNGQGNFSLFLKVSNPGVLGPPSFCVLSFTDFLIVLLVLKKSSTTPYQIINVQQYHMLTTWSICHQGQNIIHQAFLMSTNFQNLTPQALFTQKYLLLLSIFSLISSDIWLCSYSHWRSQITTLKYELFKTAFKCITRSAVFSS